MVDSKSNRNKVTRPNPFSKIWDWFVLIFFGLGLLFIFSGYLLKAKNPTRSFDVPGKKSIKIQLFGGCGKQGEIKPIAERLRELGVDVVDITSETGNIYPVSLIIDRRGNRLVADSIASILGLSRKNIVLQRYDLIVDATVVIGLDYPHIKQKLGIQG